MPRDVQIAAMLCEWSACSPFAIFTFAGVSSFFGLTPILPLARAAAIPAWVCAPMRSRSNRGRWANRQSADARGTEKSDDRSVVGCPAGV